MKKKTRSDHLDNKNGKPFEAETEYLYKKKIEELQKELKEKKLAKFTFDSEVAALFFPLPMEREPLNRALRGSEAINDLMDIDNKLRSLVKHGDPTKEVEALAEEIREITAKWWCV